jgi:hypothetical protein
MVELSVPLSMSVTPVRRSLRIALQQAARPHRTHREIQTNTYALMNVHKRTLMDDWITFGTTLNKMEILLKESTAIHPSTMKTYLKLHLDLLLAGYNYYFITCDKIDKFDENMLSGHVPCVSFMHNLRMRIQQFTMQLKYDTNDAYIIREIYPVFCKRLLKEIHAHSE